jgi:tRNA (guanine37-N1)-methyltransferase|tara:strand:+ start:521 stop:1249 length:729 start_codon:yes stop_codon:yes gene_type:complete
MHFNLITIFPELVENYVSHGIIAKAIEAKKLSIMTWNPREFSADKNKRIDEKPYGGGPGMVLQPEPLIETINHIKKKNKTYVVSMAPHGRVLNQKKLSELSKKKNLTIISGRYEGIDNRVEETSVDEVCSLGDYVLNGGELPSLILLEGIARLIEGVLGDDNSLSEESFNHGLLEFPQYTRPENSKYGNVPEVLLSGNHAEIKRWRLKESLRRTLSFRPDLIELRNLTVEEKELINEIKGEG